MATRIYVGPLPAGRVRLPNRSPQFNKGEPLEVTDAEAALLDDEWAAPKARKAEKSADPTPGDTPTSKEP